MPSPRAVEALVDGGRSGRVTDGQIQAMRREMPNIYAGRTEGDTFIWCRANRSMRIFEHVVERLADGRQPDPQHIAETSYLMRKERESQLNWN